MATLACAIKSDLINLDETMKILGVSKSVLYRLRQKEGFPKGKYAYNKQKMYQPRIVFSRKEIEEWKSNNVTKRLIDI